MLRLRRKTMLLACALLALPGVAGAQASPAQVSDSSVYRVRNFYFVFKLATTLPLTVQDTPECAADEQAVSGGPALAAPRRITYSFVSPLDRAALAQALDTFLSEHPFQPADLPAAERDRSWDSVETARTLTDPGAPGFSYTVRLHDRAAGASALCVNLRLPPASTTNPDSSSPQEPS